MEYQKSWGKKFSRFQKTGGISLEPHRRYPGSCTEVFFQCNKSQYRAKYSRGLTLTSSIVQLQLTQLCCLEKILGCERWGDLKNYDWTFCLGNQGKFKAVSIKLLPRSTFFIYPAWENHRKQLFESNHRVVQFLLSLQVWAGPKKGEGGWVLAKLLLQSGAC